MRTETLEREHAGPAKGPKYHLDIENRLYDWDQDTITTEQIANLGGWEPSLGVIMVDDDNNEQTLAPNQVIDLKPGLGFSKKVHWKRG